MTPKVKAQKTRLSNYLVNDLGAKRTKSQSTSSEYFELEGMKIRISDHTTKRENGLNIYIPFNDPNTFIIENNYTISVLKSLKEVKAFLHSIIFTNDMYRESYRLDIHQELVQMASEADRLKHEKLLLEEKIKTRDLTIDRLRAKGVAEGILTDPANLMLAGSVISIGGVTYPMDKFPHNFMEKIRNVIKLTKTEPL